MNTREVFDKVKKHLLKQNKKSAFCGMCRLRAPDGTACAVGCLIPDAKYYEALEDEMWKPPFMVLLRECGVDVLDDRTNAMLHVLQAVHDALDVEQWATRLDEIEKAYCT
jgi:hypothetical protein